jgi:flagellar protein FlbT
MALKITLKPHERMILGGCVLTNGKYRCELIIENKVPVLREKDILSESEAVTPCRRIYFVIQLMYVDEANLVEYHRTYWELVRDVVRAAPSMLSFIEPISTFILGGKYYDALKLGKKLIQYEDEVLNYADRSEGSLQKSPNADDVRP